MKNKKALIIIFIIIIIITGNLIYKFVSKKEKTIYYYDWQAKYIWINEESEKNTWTCFRKNFNIDKKEYIKNVICKIAVDSKYWLYINGEIVVKDGELKRGEKTNSIYYDEINIDKYLKVGENNISILVWYFGKNGFSHVDSGQGALLFQTQIGDNLIISDDTWKAIKNPAYLKDSEKSYSRLSESNIYYDSNLELDGWYLKDYDDSSWENATIYGEYNDSRWGELIKRDIPFFKYTDIKQYETSISNGETLEMKLPYNMQVVPYLKVKGKANQKIIISNDKNFDNTEFYGKVTYITKDGVQEYESPSWINGDTIYYRIPEGVEVISLGYRETGYDVKMSGKFECDDNDLNTLWEMANKTLYVNMRDTYMDCPDRERAMWIGDTSIAMEEAIYGLDVPAYQLYEKCIKTFIGWQYDGVLATVSPSISASLQLPVQNLLSICSMYDYYQYTGKKDFLEEVYPSIKEYMGLWNFGDDGIVTGSGNYFLNISTWYDSQGIIDEGILENVWYYYALDNLCKIADVLNLQEDVSDYESKLEKMNKSINEKFWDGNGYKSDNYEGYDVRANSIAVLSGIADESKYDAISKNIKNSYDNSTFMEKYVLQALSEMGKIEDVQNRIKIRYNDMVQNQDYSTTLWEYWEPNMGSKNHVWSGGPLVIMSKYFAGITPLKEGFSEILIKPQFGILNELNAKVNTINGNISLSAKKSNEQLDLVIDVPKKTLVAIEKKSEKYNISINDKKIFTDGKLNENKLVTFVNEDEKYVYVYVNNGSYNIVSK